MSASSKEYVYELNETEFPFLSGVKETRHTEGKGRRVGGGAGASAQAAKHRGGNNQSTSPDIVTKTVHDPNHVLGKRRKAHLLSECADGMVPNVPYSMNRKNRWSEIAAASLLANNSAAGQPNIDVAVVERIYTAKNEKVTAVHSLDEDGSIQTVRAKGRGTSSLASLTTKSEKKKRGSRARREAIQEALAKEEDPEDVEEKEEKAHLHYNLYAPHPNAKVFAGKSTGRDTKKASRARNVRQKMVDLSELEASELENSIHLEEETYKPSRDFKFCLGDFITENDQPATGAVIVRRQSIESVQHSEAADPEETARPFDLLDISAVLRAPVCFEWALLSTVKWPEANFVNQVQSLASNTKLQIAWLDVEHRRAAVDATRLLLKEGVSYAKPILVVIFEKVAAKNHVRVLINSSIAPTGPFSWKTLKDLMRNANVDSLASVLQVAVRIVSEWKDADDVLSASEDPSTTPNPRFATHRDLFLPNVNSSHLTKAGQALTEVKMAELLREAGRYEADGEEFERIDDSDFDSAEDEKGFADLKPARTIVKCHSCQSTVWDELFELDDSWQCRCCLRQEVINRIRARQLPISLSFVVADGSSSFDVLPAIVPLPLLSFYTKLAATDMLETSDVEIGDLSECPGCRQLVHVDRPNEYATSTCSACGVHWCTDCAAEPHWPMDCDQYKAWIQKWEKQFSLSGDASQQLLRIVCACGDATIEVGDRSESASCPSCRRHFNPTTMRLISRTYWTYDTNLHRTVKHLETDKTYQPLSIEKVPIQKTIKKDVADICSAARSARLSSQRTSDFEKKARKLKDLQAAKRLRELRKTVLILTENVIGWVYMRKMPSELSPIKTAATQLLKQFEEICFDLDQPKETFALKIDALDVSVNKLLDAVKHFD